MGRAPTFNVDVTTDDTDLALDLIEALDNHIPHEITKPFDDDPRGEIIVPDEYDSGERIRGDKLTWEWLAGYSEYAGNTSNPGLIISYTPYFSEDMETLSPKLDILTDIKTELEQILAAEDLDLEVSFYASSATI